MADLLLAAAIGLGAGVLSGMFGVGGGLMTTPALRLFLDAPALVAVGTPLLVIIPTAATGAYSYARRDSVDMRAGLGIGVWGALTSILGAFGSDLLGGTVVLLVTAVIIGYMALDMLREVYRPSNPARAAFPERHLHRGRALMALGVATGLYSGFLGLGGGFILVPMLVRVFGMPIKRAIGTSLVAIAVLAIPGSVTHWFLGHIDITLALGLMLGVIPGALVGARLTAAATDRTLRVGFAALLIVAGLALALNELGVIGG